VSVVLFVGFGFQRSVGPGQRRRLQVATGKGEPLHDPPELRRIVREPYAGSVVLARKINQDRLGAVEHKCSLGDDRQRAQRIEFEISRGTFFVSGMNVDVHFDIGTAERGEQQPDLVALIVKHKIVQRQFRLGAASCVAARSAFASVPRSRQRRKPSAHAAAACRTGPRFTPGSPGSTM
jgi:hypothetical protein